MTKQLRVNIRVKVWGLTLGRLLQACPSWLVASVATFSLALTACEEGRECTLRATCGSVSISKSIEVDGSVLDADASAILPDAGYEGADSGKDAAARKATLLLDSGLHLANNQDAHAGYLDAGHVDAGLVQESSDAALGLLGCHPETHEGCPFAGSNQSDAGNSLEYSDVRPYCLVADGNESNTCVECLRDAQCSQEEPHCIGNTCVECLVDSECREPGASRCSAAEHACVPCAVDSDCLGVDGRIACDGDTGVCVQCTAKNTRACGADDNGGDEGVCDTRPGTEQYHCSGKAMTSAGTCDECVSDKQCKAGLACIRTSLAFAEGEAAQYAGYYCLLRKQPASALPDEYDFSIEAQRETYGVLSCADEARPTVALLNDITSLDGEVGGFCGLGVSTCTALYAEGEQECRAEEDVTAECGGVGVADSLCIAAGGASYCRAICRGDNDCPRGVACVGVSGLRHCEK